MHASWGLYFDQGKRAAGIVGVKVYGYKLVGRLQSSVIARPLLFNQGCTHGGHKIERCDLG